jgi:hypothetical protein
MGLHDPFGHMNHKLWPKEGLGIKLAIWLLTIKSLESTQFPYTQVTCDTSLKTFQQGLQLCFRPHPDHSSAHKVITQQSRESSNFSNFKTPIWESETKSHLDVGLVERHIIYYKGGGGGFPQVRAVVSLVNPSLPVAPPSTKSALARH